MNASKKDQNAIKHLNFIANKMDEAMGKQKSYYDAIHQVCVLVAYHAMRYQDNQGANLIIERMGNGTRKQGVANWFSMFCGFKWDDKLGAFTDEVNSEHIHQNLVAAKKKPWHECMTKERLVKPIDVNDELNNVLKHINKVKGRKVEGDNLNIKPELLRNLIVALGVDVMETMGVNKIENAA